MDPVRDQSRRVEDRSNDGRQPKKRTSGTNALFGYSNSENPFNDPNLKSPFVWNKKEGSRSLSKKQLAERRQAAAEEVERVKQRRSERELEKAEKERQMLARRRELDAGDAVANQISEDVFHSNVMRMKTLRRVHGGRATYVDQLVYNVITVQKLAAALSDYKTDSRASELDPHFCLVYKVDPVGLLSSIPGTELPTLFFQLEDFGRSESSPLYRSYFTGLTCLCEDRARKLNVALFDDDRPIADGRGTESLEVVHSVMESIAAVLNKKSVEELRKLRRDVAEAPPYVLDVGFQAEVLRQLEVHIRQFEISEIYTTLIDSHASMLQTYTTLRAERLLTEGIVSSNVASVFQPVLIVENCVSSGLTAHGTSGDEIAVSANAPEGFSQAVAQLRTSYVDDHEEGSEPTEEIQCTHPEGWPWANKYAPRKPTFLNHVRSGFDWSGYNRTHFDSDNPPPKIVKGYRFNIFYPDLVDKTVAPSFKLYPTKDPSFCIIHFSAGAPYEDIAFRIVNKPWAKGVRRGFRLAFDKGILQLHFNFVRTRYKR